jgi:hypothetical protein
MTTSRLLAVAEIHGAYVPQRTFAAAKVPVPTFGMARNIAKSPGHAFPIWHRPERKFISETKIRRSRDIAVMAQPQRNAVIPVALSAK